MNLKSFFTFILFILFIQLSLGMTILDFLEDMRVNPANYEVVYEYLEPEIVSILQDFSEDNGVDFRTDVSGNKNFIILYIDVPEGVGLDYEPVAEKYVPLADYDYLKLFEGEQNYLGIHIRSEIVLTLNSFLGYIQDSENTLNAPEIYFFNGEIEEVSLVDCSFFEDNSIYEKDTYVFPFQTFEDSCYGEGLYELSCVGGKVEMSLIDCDCLNGVCKHEESSVLFELFESVRLFVGSGEISLGELTSRMLDWIKG